jgi:hypothetical protein
MTTMVAIVGGPLLVALIDLMRRRKTRPERVISGFPMLPVPEIPGGRTLLSDPAIHEKEIPLAEVNPPMAEKEPVETPVSNASPWMGTMESVPRLAPVPAPVLLLARALPSRLPAAKSLPQAQPRGFAIQPQ